MAAGHVILAALTALLCVSISCSRSSFSQVSFDRSLSSDPGYVFNRTLLCCNVTAFGLVISAICVSVAVHSRPLLTGCIRLIKLDLSQLFIHRPITWVVCLHTASAAVSSDSLNSHWNLPIPGRWANVYINLLVAEGHIDLKRIRTDVLF